MYIPLSQGNTVTEDVTPPLRAEMLSEITFFLLLPLKKRTAEFSHSVVLFISVLLFQYISISIISGS